MSVTACVGDDAVLARRLRAELPTCRWFAAKARTIRRVSVVDRASLPGGTPTQQLLWCRVSYRTGRTELYLLGLDTAVGERATLASAEAIRHPVFARALLRLALSGGRVRTRAGALLSAYPVGGRAARTAGEGSLPPPQGAGSEQSNTSIRFGRRYMLKLVRRLEAGANPEVEIGRHLARGRGFAHAPRLLAVLEYAPARGLAMTIGVVHRFVPARGDAWTAFLGRLASWKRGSGVPQVPMPSQGWLEASRHPLPAAVREALAPFAGWAELLGRRTGSLHAALALSAADVAFQPERLTAAWQAAFSRALNRQVGTTLRLLRKSRARLPAETRSAADRLLTLAPRLSAACRTLARVPVSGVLIRTHGDYHLGQVLFTGRDFKIIDFEGEPARPLSERRRKLPPVRDVAGMLRSFHYAACIGLGGARAAVADAWVGWMWAAFMRGYRAATRLSDTSPRGERDLRLVLDACLLEKALYELRYELNNRPDWVRVPLAGLLGLMEA